MAEEKGAKNGFFSNLFDQDGSDLKPVKETFDVAKTLYKKSKHRKKFIFLETTRLRPSPKCLKGLESRQSGQATLLYAVIILIAASAIAMVVHLGLLVKAKINLQNSVDAAAWSGAATQARTLSDIAYLNWEMKNNYKELLFKYYVLGSLSNPGVLNPGQPIQSPSGSQAVNQGTVDFTLPVNQASDNPDRFNIPSVCVFYRSNEDLCERYKIAGIKRYTIPDFSVVDDSLKSMVDALSKSKNKACATVSKFNAYFTMAWAYGVLDREGADQNNLLAGLPELGTNRMGAYPAALELALRIRNLENIVNRAPIKNVCKNPSEAAGQCTSPVASLETQESPQLERTVKAFYSAYRNLANADDILKRSFVLSELGPTPVSIRERSLSSLLIPGGNLEKHYLDLQMIPLNLAVFYRWFQPSYNQRDNTDATCLTSKTALPLPGFPFGFQKNPEVLTYYAVKGEAFFDGLLNPFNKETIKLTAYASAKPFGGRIGPQAFQTDEFSVRPSNESPFSSGNLVMGLEVGNIPFDASAPHYPLVPAEPDLYAASPEHVIGGVGGGSLEEGRYVLPNLQYDIVQSGSIPDSGIPSIPMPLQGPIDRTEGLYGAENFTNFWAAKEEVTPLNREATDKSIRKARSPRKIDTYNYLIPTPHKLNEQFSDVLGHARLQNNLAANQEEIDGMRLYAPLWGTNHLYPTRENLKEVVNFYVGAHKPQIDRFVDSMARLGFEIRNLKSVNDVNLTREAADIFADEPLSCNSLSGSFKHFYLGAREAAVTDTGTCPTPLTDSLERYFSLFQSGQRIAYEGAVYYPKPDSLPYEDLFSAYFPGPFSGASEEGEVKNPFVETSKPELTRRNIYSTKFIPLKSVQGNYFLGNSTTRVFSEGRQTSSESKTLRNRLNFEREGIPNDLNF